MSSHFMLHLTNRPVLLKIIHLVLSELILSPFSDEKFTKSRSILVSPSLLSETITKSSAQSMLPHYCMGSACIRFLFMSEENITNERVKRASE